MTNIPNQSPANQEQLVVAVFSDRTRADQAIAMLQHAGFGQNQIGAAVQEEQPLMTPQAEAALDQEAEATSTGVAVGGLAGSTAGIAAGVAIGSIGGPLGTVIGGIAGALVGIAAGSSIGEAVGERNAHTDRFGVPDERVQHYSTAVQAGQIVVSVHAHNRNDVQCAREVLSRFADDIHVYDPRDAPADLPTSEGGSEGSGQPGL